MRNTRYFTPQEKIELEANPYTFRVTDTTIHYTLAFKKYVLANVNKPGMTVKKLFENAGYRTDLFTDNSMRKAIARFKREAESEGGLQEPTLPKKTSKQKAGKDSQIKELEQRIVILEQQLDFLKKTRHLELTGELPPDDID